MKIPSPELPEPTPRRRRPSTIEQAAATTHGVISAPELTVRNAPPVVVREGEPNARETGPVRRPARPTGKSKDILLSLDDELKNRMVSTVAFTAPYTGIKHQQVFIRRAIAELCERYEREYNSGERFPSPAEPDQ